MKVSGKNGAVHETKAEALAVWSAAMPPELEALSLKPAALRARAKLIDSFPDRTRAVMAEAAARFPRDPLVAPTDPRVAAIAGAIRDGLTLRPQARSPHPVVLRP